jgi:predicted neuraminidase
MIRTSLELNTRQVHLRPLIPLLLLCAAAPSSRGQSPHPSQEFIFTSAPFPSAHASTIVELPNGDLLAAWFGGTAEGAPDTAIWASRRTANQANQWSAPYVLVREPNIACWNPVLFHSADGKLWLYYKFGPSARTWTGARLVSNDEAHSWSQPDHLPAGLLGPIKDKPLVLDDGTIVSGTSVESYSSWAAWIDRSTDNGKTWTKIGPIGPITLPSQPSPSLQPSQPNQAEHVSGIIQPTIIPLGNKHLRLYARSTSDIGRICIADSFDDGLTWTHAHPTDLPNPNSGIDAVALRDGRVVLIYNNTTTGRTPLNLAVSTDGEHFKIFDTLEDQPGEYSYPTIIQGKAGELDMTYTWNRQRIRFATVPLANVPGAP